jgi:hypothetical protein
MHSSALVFILTVTPPGASLSGPFVKAAIVAPQVRWQGSVVLDRNIHEDAEGLSISEGFLKVSFIGITYMRVNKAKRGAMDTAAGDSAQQRNRPPWDDGMRTTGNQPDILQQISFIVSRGCELA